jgi:hypothetical protein
MPDIMDSSYDMQWAAHLQEYAFSGTWADQDDQVDEGDVGPVEEVEDEDEGDVSVTEKVTIVEAFEMMNMSAAPPTRLRLDDQPTLFTVLMATMSSTAAAGVGETIFMTPMTKSLKFVFERAFICNHFGNGTKKHAAFERCSPHLLHDVTDIFDIKLSGTFEPLVMGVLDMPWINIRISVVEMFAKMATDVVDDRAVTVLVDSVKTMGIVWFIASAVTRLIPKRTARIIVSPCRTSDLAKRSSTSLAGVEVNMKNMMTDTVHRRIATVRSSVTNTKLVYINAEPVSMEEATAIMVEGGDGLELALNVKVKPTGQIIKFIDVTRTSGRTIRPSLMSTKSTMCTVVQGPPRPMSINFDLIGAIRFYNANIRCCRVGKACYECTILRAAAVVMGMEIAVPRPLAEKPVISTTVDRAWIDSAIGPREDVHAGLRDPSCDAGHG